MLVDKVFTEDGKVQCLYKSSNILMSEWDEKEKTLIVTFNHGVPYLYSKVDPKDYLRFEIDESQGKVLNAKIKKYDCTKLDKVDVSEMKGRLNEILNKGKTINE